MAQRLAKVAPLLFISGLCALIYQVVWLRELRLIFGSSTPASAAVLAIFMGGLGLGSALFGKRADASPRPLGFYGTLELWVAVSSACSPVLMVLVRNAYIALGGAGALGDWGATAIRLVLSTLVLLVPTAAMGGTLPAAARAVASAGDQNRRSVAVLYGVNALGAVTGVLFATFFLMEVFGARTTLWLACLLNALVALTARAMARDWPQPPSVDADAVPAQSVSAPPLRFLLAMAAVVGFAFFLMELVWYRMLGPILGGSTFTFGLILAVALFGIALGGMLYAALQGRTQATLTRLAWVCALEAFFFAVPFALGDTLALTAAFLRSLGAFGFAGMTLGWTAITALVVLPGAVVAGFQFPLLIALVGRGPNGLGREVGLAYVWNTAGSIVGSLAGGFGLLAWLSAPGTWKFVVIVLLAVSAASLALSLRQSSHDRVERLLAPSLGLLAATLMFLSVGPTAAWRHSAIGSGRAQVGGLLTVNQTRAWVNDQRDSISWEHEGRESSVALHSANGHSFIVNGKSDGAALSDAPTQVMGGLIGALLHPAPKRALVIGLGTGSTAGWLAAVPSIERVDVLEIEPGIVEVARRCSPVNHDALDNPKLRIIVGDARELLLTSREQYDIVFSEPSNPYRAGIASLFTREFYQAVKQRLAPGGLFLQWVQSYEIDADTMRSIYATLVAEFPFVETWQTQAVDTVLVGSQAPVSYDVGALRQKIAEAPFNTALEATWRVSELEGVLGHFIADERLAQGIAQLEGERWNTDDQSGLEYGLARHVGRMDRYVDSVVWETARKAGLHRPTRVRGEVDWERVELETLLMFSAAHPIAVPPRVSLDVQHRFTTLSTARQGNLRYGLELWKKGGWSTRGPLERALVAEMLAEAGDELALNELPPQSQQWSPFDWSVVARLRWRQQKDAEATEALERSWRGYRRDPWAPYDSMVRSLSVGLGIARKSPDLGRRLYDALKQPFAVSAMEALRRSTALLIAETVDYAQMCLEPLTLSEPHPRWELAFLEARARCYALNQHPLHAQAQHDLNTFREEAAPAFEQGLVAPNR